MSTAPIVVAPPEGWPQIDGLVPSEALAAALGQSVATALDLEGWQEGTALEETLTRVRAAIERSIRDECRLRETIRSNILAKLHEFPAAPAAAGVYHVSDAELRAARRSRLLSGEATACEGVSTGHDSLTATVVGIGVCLVRYDGLINSWRSNFFRHDYDSRVADPIANLKSLLDRRSKRNSPGPPASNEDADPIHALLRRGFMAAAERRALLEKASTRWRIGGGVPAPLELITGSGSMELIDLALPMLDELLLKNTRWVFVPSSLSRRAWLTVANALESQEVAIFQNGRPMLDEIIEAATYAPGYRRKVERFASRLGENTVIGAFRATRYAPSQLFVAHADQAVEAGVLAMADASLQPHRGTPLLLELARLGAATGLGTEAFQGIIEASYARIRASELFQSGRVTITE